MSVAWLPADCYVGEDVCWLGRETLTHSHTHTQRNIDVWCVNLSLFQHSPSTLRGRKNRNKEKKSISLLPIHRYQQMEKGSPSLSSIAPGRSSKLHPASAQSSCIYVLADRPAFARPCQGVHLSMSLMSSSLLLQQCSAYLVCLTWIVFVISGKWPSSCYFVGCCLHVLINITRSILV